ncbi:MAG: 3-deoxy-manno-octulosonate cytidylyltransferase [Kiritimatiellae bacterium]|nr:3-deoxy-manno-octulosonate cytidylyltransferase [Kiritimatiellia bacterium]
MRAIGVIPARWASTRLPGKSLVPLCGKPLVLWVAERARQAKTLDAVLVATDDARILAACEQAGCRAVMTRGDHESGTDRVAEAAGACEADVVVNIQGDEPLIDPALIDALVAVMREEEGWDMATAASPIESPEVLREPSVVKVVFGARGQALYFSRAPIPFVRDAGFVAEAPLHWRHLGIYAYRRAFLARFVQTPPCVLERAERLEQLRALALGARIKVVATRSLALGVDVPEDVPRAEAALREAGLA